MRILPQSTARRGAIVLLCLAFTGIARAQERPVIFQHGINSNQDTWDTLVPQLTYAYQIAPYRWTTGTFLTFELQGSNLAQYASNASVPSNAYIVAHSNGMNVARQANRDPSHPLSFETLISVGATARGAPLAANGMSGALGQWARDLTHAQAAPLLTYAGYEIDSYWWLTWAGPALTFIRDVTSTFEGFLYGLHWIVGATEPADLLYEMDPSSGFLADLNSEANRSRENAVIPHRIAIVSTLGSSYDGVIIRALTGSESLQNNYVNYRSIAEGLQEYLFLYYMTYDDVTDPFYYDKIMNADLWIDAYDALSDADKVWCAMIGASDPTQNNKCLASDGIVPAVNQSAQNTQFTVPIENVSHSEETSSLTTYAALVGLFGTGPIAIAERSHPSPPLATVSITGPDATPGFNSDTWNAQVTGGQAAFSYRWYVNGQLKASGTHPYLIFSNTGADFEVSVTVTDATGATVTSYKDVYVY